MSSRYGNYVVQRAYDLSDQCRRDILQKKIELVVQMGRVNPSRAHAKHVFNYLESKFGVTFVSSEMMGPAQPEEEKRVHPKKGKRKVTSS